MAAPKATLGGEPLTLGDSQIQFPLKYGVSPVIKEYVITRARANRIMKNAGSPMTLRIGTAKFQQIYVIQSSAGNDDVTRGIVVADRRWLWRRKLVDGGYNITRRTGDFRLLGEGNPVQTKIPTPDIEFVPWSLKDHETEWETEEIIVDLFSKIGIKKDELVIPKLSRTIEVKDFDLTGSSFADAVSELMGYLGGYEIYINYEGKIVFTDTLIETEIEAIKNAPAAWDKTGWIERVDRSPIRPSKVEIYFEREIELRFDYDEDEQDSALSGTSPKITGGREDMVMENVLPCPDPTMTVTDRSGKTREVTQGSWITFREFLRAIAGSEVGVGGVLTQKKIREHWFAPGPMIFKWAIVSGSMQQDLTWSRRIAMVLQHWRQTFRLLPKWNDKVRTIRAFRLGTVDPETGMRSPAQCFMDYCAIPTIRGMVLRKKSTGDSLVGWQAEDYKDILDSDSQASPVAVSIMDTDQSIFRLSLRRDPSGQESIMIPGIVDTLPTIAPSKRLAASTNNPVLTQQLNVSSDWKAATILSAIQASPNNLGRMHKEERTFSDVADKLGIKKPGKSNGPVWQVKVQPSSLTTARFMWSDYEAEHIKESFFEGEQITKTLLINESFVTAIADAVAARVYSTVLDRAEGAMVTTQMGGAEPGGALAEVTQGIASDGTGHTSWAVPPVFTVPDMLAFLPRSIRRTLLMMAQP